MPIQRPLAGDALRFDLDEETRRASDPEALRRTGRSGRTLLKEGPLRVTLIVLAEGGNIPEHHTEGSLAIQVLRGEMTVTVDGTEHALGVGDLLSIHASVPHAVHSRDGAAFLLTLAIADGSSHGPT